MQSPKLLPCPPLPLAAPAPRPPPREFVELLTYKLTKDHYTPRSDNRIEVCTVMHTSIGINTFTLPLKSMLYSRFLETDLEAGSLVSSFETL